ALGALGVGCIGYVGHGAALRAPIGGFESPTLTLVGSGRGLPSGLGSQIHPPGAGPALRRAGSARACEHRLLRTAGAGRDSPSPPPGPRHARGLAETRRRRAAYLFSLTGVAHPAPAWRQAAEQRVNPQLRQLINGMPDNPAMVLNRRTDLLAWNPAAVAPPASRACSQRRTPGP
ncbi:MAG: hypothetical protein QOI83_3553, partial [Streptomycetaceae bacterium]|nr:hypothetical protein [Streptomycetaceae bacterium]